MEPRRKLASYVKRHGVGDSGRAADFDESGPGVFGNAESEARRPAHEYVRGVAVNQDGGRTEGHGAKVGAGNFNITKRKRGGRMNVFNEGIWENFRSAGLNTRARHIST
jgi:hypothetical protein